MSLRIKSRFFALVGKAAQDLATLLSPSLTLAHFFPVTWPPCSFSSSCTSVPPQGFSLRRHLLTPAELIPSLQTRSPPLTAPHELHLPHQSFIPFLLGFAPQPLSLPIFKVTQLVAYFHQDSSVKTRAQTVESCQLPFRVILQIPPGTLIFSVGLPIVTGTKYRPPSRIILLSFVLLSFV